MSKVTIEEFIPFEYEKESLILKMNEEDVSRLLAATGSKGKKKSKSKK